MDWLPAARGRRGGDRGAVRGDEGAPLLLRLREEDQEGAVGPERDTLGSGGLPAAEGDGVGDMQPARRAGGRPAEATSGAVLGRGPDGPQRGRQAGGRPEALPASLHRLQEQEVLEEALPHDPPVKLRP